MQTRYRGQRSERRRGWKAILAFVVLSALWPVEATAQRPSHRSAAPAPAKEGAVRLVTADASGYAGQLNLPVGGSKILKFTQPVGRVLLGEPKVADVVPLSDRTLYVLGKAAGTTNLTVMRGDSANPIATLDVHVGFDAESLERAYQDLMPGEDIQVSLRGDGLVLAGTVTSSAVAARAAALAERYAPARVINLMAVRGAEQVMLTVRVAEVQRAIVKQLGITSLNELVDSTGGVSLDPNALVLNPDAFLNLFGRAQSLLPNGSTLTVDALFNALERKGYASTLAQPKLTALSGETAVFFAGGEFPIPVPQISGGGQSQITITYKEYGVHVGFTPTVYGDTINLVVQPEVSALDPQNGVTLQGFRIPALTTRRARTVVELKNGQSFAIAGLIRKDFTNQMRGWPGLTDVPLFGALFRSTSFQNNETEAVIIVTAHLAKPTDRKNLLLPTETRQAPSEVEFWLTPNVDKAVANPQPSRVGVKQ